MHILKGYYLKICFDQKDVDILDYFIRELKHKGRMGFVDKLEKKIGFLAIPNLTSLLILVQVVVYFLMQQNASLAENIVLVPAALYQGEYWRALTFLFFPPLSHPILMFFAWYIFYVFGKSLENYWGDFKYTLFLLVGWLATLVAALLIPLLFSPFYAMLPISNGFIATTVFLAFARLNPDLQIMLFFILPIKVKWLAWLTWVGYFYLLILGDWNSRLLTVAAIFNYTLFFGKSHYQDLRYGKRQIARKLQNKVVDERAVHCCLVCGATEKSNPEKEFRYCSKCKGQACYCLEHLQTHEHK